MNWYDKQLKFSIRKLKVAVASIVVGLGFFSAVQEVGSVQTVHANDLASISQSQQVSVNYLYVRYDDLSPEQQRLLHLTDLDFTTLVAEKDTTYVLVYGPKYAATSLPKTGEVQGSLISVLAALGVSGIILAIRRRNKKLVVTVMVVTGLGTTFLAGPAGQALETGLRTFLKESHLVKIGEQLPQPSHQIDHLEFQYYIPQEELEGRSNLQVEQPSQLTERLEEMPFERIYQDDSNLPLGTERVLQAGQVGQKRQTLTNGIVTKEEILRQPVNEVVVRGIKAVSQTGPLVTTSTEVIPFDTETVPDDTLPLGEEQEVQAGQNGIRTLTYHDGQLVSSEVTTAPVNRVVKQGTKLVAVPVVTTSTEVIPFDTETVPDDTLPLGEEQEVQAGQNGIRTLTYHDGQLVSSEVTTAPVNRVVKRGTKTDTLPLVTTSTEVIPFDTETVPDDSLPLGEEQEVQSGQNGVRTLTYHDGQLVSSEVTTAPTNRIVKRGTKATPLVDKTRLQAALNQGASRLTETYTPESLAVLQGAVANSRAVFEDPSATQDQVDQATQAINEVIAALVVPRQPLVEVSRETIPFKVVERQDDTLPEGQREVDQVGREGEKEVTKTDGVVTSERVITPAQDELVRVGTLVIDKTALKAAIDLAKTKPSADYEPTKFAELLAKLAEAESVYGDSAAKQSAIDAKTAELKQAIAALTTNKDALKSAIDLAKTKPSADYEPIKFAEMQAKLAEAESVYEDPAAKQSTIDVKTAELERAIAALTTDKTALKTAIDSAKTKQSADYEPTKFAELQAKLAEAESVYGDPAAKQSAIAAKTSELNAAISALTTDKTALKSAIDLAKAKQATDYEPTKFAELQAKLTEAESVYGDPVAKQSVIDAKTAELEQAIAALTTDKTALKTAIDLAKSKPSADYEPTKFAEMLAKLAEAESVYGDPAAKQSAIDTKTAELERAIAALTTNKEALKAAIDLAKTKPSADYEPTKFAELQAKLAEAESVYEDPAAKQSTIDTKTADLERAIAALTTDKIALKTAIDLAKTKPSADYEPTKFAELQVKLAEAESVYSDPVAKQSAIDAKTSELNAAISALTTNKDELRRKVVLATSKLAGDYTSASYQAMAAELEKARTLLANPTATQSAIDQQTQALQVAIDALTTNKAALREAIARATAKVATEHTTTSFDAMTTVLNQAKTVLDTAAAKQFEIDAKTQELLTAIANLVKLKRQPTLVWNQLTKDDLDKTATASYSLTDDDTAFQSATISIFAGDTQVGSAITLSRDDLAGKELSFPEYDVKYTIKTSYTYDVGNGPVTETLPDKNVEFELKKLEIKDVDSLSLYKLVDGGFVKQGTLPADLGAMSDYFVRVASDRFRDMLLPVKTIVSEDLPTGGSAYRVTTNLEELVEDKDPSAQSAYEEQFSFLVQKTPVGNVFTSFKSLIEAMRGNLSGNFVIGADLFADEVTIGANEAAYITNDFRGTLTGLSDGQQYAIYNTKLPLFNSLVGATVSNLDLKNVAINTSRSNMAGLANNATSNSQITDVSVQGALTTLRGVAGVVHNVVQSTLTNTSFTGQLTTTATTTGGSNVGGVVGVMTRGTVQKSYAKADITVNGASNDVRVGGLVGFNNNGYLGASFRNPSMIDVYTEGTLTKTGNLGVAGGIVGSTEHGSYQGRVQNGISKMVVTNGNPIYGYTGILPNSMIETYTTTADAQPQTGRLTEQEADAKIAAMGITTTLTDTGLFTDGQAFSTDYTTLPKAMAERKTAYENIEKLMPFYNKELIVKYGNLVDPSHKLYQTKLLSVTPMKGDDIISDVNAVKEDLNKLMLHYGDGKVAYLDIAYKEDFRNKAVSEYTIKDTELIYTPEQFLSNYDGLVNSLQASLESVTYNSTDMVKAIGSYSETDLLNAMIARAQAQVGGVAGFIIPNKGTLFTVLRRQHDHATTTALMQQIEADTIRDFNENLGTISNQMARLYLEPTFDQVKANISTLLRQVLATDKSINTTGGIVDHYLEDYIRTNKEKLMMGLAYVTRWYNIDFQGTNIKNLATFHQDFYGKPVNTLEWLVSLGSYELLSPPNNVTTYASHMAPNTTKTNLLTYLTSNRELFTSYADDNEWFKNTTKAFVVEQQSEELGTPTLKVYDTLSMPSQQNGILPLLTAREGIFVLSTLGGITYGMYDRYYDLAEIRNLPREQQIEKIKDMARLTAKRHAEFFDVWYRIAPENLRNNLIRPDLTTWDGYKVGNTWTPMFGAGATNATLDFFGPVGGRSGVANNNSGAYADGSSTKFVGDRVLTDYGSSVYTHETVHNNDGSVYLGGTGRRHGMGGEFFALGLLQSSSYGGPSERFLTLNMIYDYTAQEGSASRTMNMTPERFQDSGDLQEYMSGVFDVLYTLDYAEAKAASSLTSEQKINHFAVIENYMDGVHAGNKIRLLMAEEADRLTDWDKFIEGNIVGRREYGLQDYRRNFYWHSYLFTPNYAHLSNPTGAPGDLMFRRMAFELMADKGYEGGFIPYTSNQLKPANSTVTDDIVLQGIYGDTYPSWLELKKDLFRKRIDKLGELKTVTINYLGKQEVIDSYEKLQELMTAAVKDDVVRGIRTTINGSRVHALKLAIYNAYLRQTNDFEQSIYRN